MNKAVFLDRDGTLNVDFGYVHNIKHFKLLPGVLYTLKELKQRGYLLIIITNQSGIERGYYTERQYIEFENEIYSFFEDRGVTIDDIFHCPHYITICNCRKPKVELFYKAREKYDIDFMVSYAVGDRKRDLSICNIEPVKGILITNAKDDCYVTVTTFPEILNYIQ